MRKPVPPETVERILRLDTEGRSQQHIADDVGLRRETVCRILHRYHDKAFDRIIGKLAATRSRHVSRLEHAADLAMQAFVAKPTAQFLAEYRAALADIRSVLGISNRFEPNGDIPAVGSDAVTKAMISIAKLQEARDAGQPDPDDGDGDGDDGRNGGGSTPPNRPETGTGQGERSRSYWGEPPQQPPPLVPWL
jgi:hypothetical protein